MPYLQQNPGTSARVFDLWLNLETLINSTYILLILKNCAERQRAKRQEGQSAN